jgi:hypothetical protein
MFSIFHPARVARLGEFSPMELLFTLGIVLKLQKLPNFLGYFFQVKSYVLFLTKIGFCNDLGNFSQTHLVTLNPADLFHSFLLRLTNLIADAVPKFVSVDKLIHSLFQNFSELFQN